MSDGSAEENLPVIWLLGKTGAGKSSLVHQLTGLPDAVIGNGFTPCTRTATHFDFPQGAPLMRFLDTRGLGEAHYDPTEDLAKAEEAAHLLIVVAKLDDPVQGEVADALAKVRRAVKAHAVLVHSGGDLVPDAQERARAMARTQAVFAKALGTKVPEVEANLKTGEGMDALREIIAAKLPELADLIADAEGRRWLAHRDLVLWYAGTAAGADTLPVVGAVGAPATQVAMLTSLALKYGVEWNWKRRAEFGAALGLGAAAGYGASYGVRQLVKLVPVVGQTAGAAASGLMSFAATVALGRAAAVYLHRVSSGEAVEAEEIKRKYGDALRRRQS